MTFQIHTLGCRVNQYESEAMAELLEKYGYKSSDEKNADLVIVNTCAVTSESEKKSRQLLRKSIRLNPSATVAVCGCSSQINPNVYLGMDGVDYVWGCRNKNLLVEKIITQSEIKEIDNRAFNNESELCSTMISKFDRVRAYVKIEDGCDGRCAYCIISKARGGAVSREENEITEEVKRIVSGGCSEVVLTGIETGAYKPSLALLIKKINEIDGIKRIRLGSMDPACIDENFLQTVSQCEKFMPHFHLSLQSGSSSVLGRMKRKYSAEMAKKTIELIRKYYPGSCLTADVICGFPGETEEEFAQTLEFVKKVGFLHIHIFPYSNRKGTAADTMDGQISPQTKDARCLKLSEEVRREKKNILQKYVNENSVTEVLAERFDGEYIYGHTENFIEAKIKSKRDLKGMIVRAEIVGHNGEELLCRME